MYANVLATHPMAENVQQDGGVTVPGPLFFTGLGVVLGFLLGPAVLAATDAGRKELARLVREKIEK